MPLGIDRYLRDSYLPCRWREPHATHRHRGPGPATAHRSVAFPGVRGDPCRSPGKTTGNLTQNAEVMEKFWLVKLPALLLGALRVTVFIDWALQQSVLLRATLRKQHAVSDPGSARIEA